MEAVYSDCLADWLDPQIKIQGCHSDTLFTVKNKAKIFTKEMTSDTVSSFV